MRHVELKYTDHLHYVILQSTVWTNLTELILFGLTEIFRAVQNWTVVTNAEFWIWNWVFVFRWGFSFGHRMASIVLIKFACVKHSKCQWERKIWGCCWERFHSLLSHFISRGIEENKWEIKQSNRTTLYFCRYSSGFWAVFHLRTHNFLLFYW